MYWPRLARAWSDQLASPYPSSHVSLQKDARTVLSSSLWWSLLFFSFDCMNQANLLGHFSRTKTIRKNRQICLVHLVKTSEITMIVRERKIVLTILLLENMTGRIGEGQLMRPSSV
jgi:hypothetical protein